jgi:hypothetical protein
VDEDEDVVSLPLPDGTVVAVRAERLDGEELVADERLLKSLESVTSSIETIGREVLEAVKRISPESATVELGFGLAIEAGQLIALFGKPKGEATIKLTLEWKKG